jgi:hypothetical protein
MDKRVGHYAFIIGVIIAVVLGLAASALNANTVAVLTSILVVLGLVAGFMNVTGKETKEFLTIAAILVIVSYAGGAAANLGAVLVVGKFISGIFSAIMAFVVPATVVVGLKDILELAQNP